MGVYSDSGEEKRRKRGEGFSRRRVEEEDGYFRGQRRRINSVIRVSLRNTRRAFLPFFFSTEAIISRTLVPL